MKKVFLLTVSILVIFQLNARTIYVSQGSNGNGTSWADAFGDLQLALNVAQAGDEIWVASGKYLPTQGNDRNASFLISNGIKLLGGFAGFETTARQRNWETNLTVLSGEIGSHSIDDNSFSVIITQGVSRSTMVDGFVITGGSANGTGAKGSVTRCGAGWYNDGSQRESSPTISNCLFVNNYARDGAGIYNYAKYGSCNPTVTNCQFISNRADLDGGAVYNDGSYGSCNATFENCLFEANEATYGAGMINQGDRGEARPLVSNCVFSANISYIKGSGIYNSREGNGICDPIIQACRFSENRSSVGRDISSTVNNNSSGKDKSAMVFRSGF